MLGTLPLCTERLTLDRQDQYWRDGFLFALPGLTAKGAATARLELDAIEFHAGLMSRQFHSPPDADNCFCTGSARRRDEIRVAHVEVRMKDATGRTEIYA